MDNQSARSSHEDRTQSIDIQFLYLDLEVCEPCQETESNLDETLGEVSELLEKSGFSVNLEKIHIDSEATAIAYQFLSSPTIRVDGKDIQLDYKESDCPTCGTLTKGTPVDCRIWVYDGNKYHAPPKQMIIDSVMAAIGDRDKGIVHRKSDAAYELPENLKTFFARKGANGCASSRDVGQDSCGCNTGCC